MAFRSDFLSWDVHLFMSGNFQVQNGKETGTIVSRQTVPVSFLQSEVGKVVLYLFR